ASGGIVTIPHGVRTARISVPIHGDAQHEPDESFYVGIGDPSNARIATYQGQVTILDDDPSPPPEEHHDPPPPAHEPPPPKPPATQPPTTPLPGIHVVLPPPPRCVARRAPRTPFRQGRRGLRAR